MHQSNNDREIHPNKAFCHSILQSMIDAFKKCSNQQLAKYKWYLESALWQQTACDNSNTKRPRAGWTKHTNITATSAEIANGLNLIILATCLIKSYTQAKKFENKYFYPIKLLWPKMKIFEGALHWLSEKRRNYWQISLFRT